MMRGQPTSRHDDQTRAVAALLRRVLGDGLLAVYLHGSAVSEGLKPHSDIDILAVVNRAVTDAERGELLSGLLRISGRHPAPPGGPRCLEVAIFLAAELAGGDYPASTEFMYGEWLRSAFEAGEVPMPQRDPENTLFLAQARGEARPLLGPDARESLPEIPRQRILRAMRDTLPALLDGLEGDERNVLLTLARMWRTAKAGDFVSKDAAARWAIPRMPEREARTLDRARKAYLGEIRDDWSGRQDAVRQTATHLRARVSALLS